MYEVMVSAEVAKLRPGNRGTRNAKLASGQVLTFSRHPTYLEELPEEIAGDDHLVTRQLTTTEWKRLAATGVRTTELRPERLGNDQPAAEIPGNLDELSYNDLMKLAASHGLDTGGKKADLVARLTAARPKSGATE